MHPRRAVPLTQIKRNQTCLPSWMATSRQRAKTPARTMERYDGSRDRRKPIRQAVSDIEAGREDTDRRAGNKVPGHGRGSR